MNLLSKLTIKNLKLNKKRTIVTIVGIILSVALITAVASIYTSGIASLIDYEIGVKGNFHVGFIGVAIDDIDTIKNNREVEDIYITQEVGYSVLEDSKNEYKPYCYVMAFTEESLENLAITLTEGRLPENDTEIVIPTHLKTNGRIELNVGDTITLDVGTRLRDGEVLNQNNSYELDWNEEIVDTETKTYTIVGIVERPSTEIEAYSAPGYTFITYLDESKLTDENVNVYARYTKSGTKNYLSVTANILGVDEEIFSKYMTDDYTSYEEQEKVFEKYYEEISKAKYEFNINSYLIELESNPLNNSTTGSLMGIAIVVCMIIVVTSVFCIKNSFDISITEKIRQYGMLKSIGATKRQIKKNVLFEGAILGLIGIPLGILCGFLASYILIIVSTYFLANSMTEGFTLIFEFSWIAVLVAIILGSVTIYLSSIGSARCATKISPIDSIRNSGDIKIKSKKVKINKLIHKIFGIGGDISYKNLKRNKKKYRTTVVSITISVMVFIALFSFLECAFAAIEEDLNIYDYDISLSISNYEDIYNGALETLNLDNIDNYSIVRRFDIDIENPQYSKEYMEKESSYNEYGAYVMIASVGEYQYKEYIEELGLNYDEIKDKGILIYNKKVYTADTEYYISKISYSKGDLIKGVNIDSNEKEECEIEIGYITDEMPFGLEGRNSYTSYIIVSDECYNTFETQNNLYDTVYFFYKSDNIGKLQDDIEDVLVDFEGSYDLTNMQERAQIQRDLFTLIGIFLYGFIIVISLIGITNIFNTITTSMQLRRREFASLKSIGMTETEFRKMINLESIFLGTKSLFFGIIFGTILSYIIYNAMEGVSFQIPIFAIVVSIVAVFLLISCIMRYSMNKINKQNVIETIRNENI